MWLSSSTVGRKVVMSISGLFLILFLTFHMSMNLVALFSAEGYNAVCGFLGANWYALVGTLVLAFGMFVHIIYAFWLTIQNRRARGNVRYAVVDKPKGVEWASQNMLVLGIIVIGVACFHLYHFWYNMQLQEILGNETADVAACVLGSANDLSGVSVHDGYSFIVATFSNPVVVVLYLIWFVAIWFHLTHGFWSALHTLGWNNDIWFNRWKTIANIYTTLLCLGFAVVAVAFYIKSL